MPAYEAQQLRCSTAVVTKRERVLPPFGRRQGGPLRGTRLAANGQRTAAWAAAARPRQRNPR